MKTNRIYFDTMAEAIDIAFSDAYNRGYKVLEKQHPLQPVNYGQSTKESFLLVQDEKILVKQLHIQFYRMDSGRYELNYYIQ